MKRIAVALGACLVFFGCAPAPLDMTGNAVADKAILNVSYDVSRDLYRDYNMHYAKLYPIAIRQSHGGASKQALGVANGLAADVVTLNQVSDMQMLADRGLISANWRTDLPTNAVPYTSTIVMLVRAGNPKEVRDFSDLIRPDINIVMPNPKSSGTARAIFLALYGYNQDYFDNADTATRQMLANVLTYDNGARASTTTFVQRRMGDVLLTTENEAHISLKAFGSDQVEILYPSKSILIENPVAVVTATTQKKGTQEAAHAYLAGLWSPQAQEIIAQSFMRPKDPEVLARHQDTFPALELFDPHMRFGDADAINAAFFADGAKFDTLSRN